MLPQNPRPSSDPEIDRILSGYVKDKVKEEATRQGVPADFADRMAGAESSYKPDVIKGQRRSSAGAIGPMQLMPGTAKDLKVDPYNVNQNVEGGVRYAKQQLDAFGGDQRKASAAYNWGPGRVQKYGLGRAPAETQDYMRKVAGQSQPQGDPEIENLLKQYQQEKSAQPIAQPQQPRQPLTRNVFNKTLEQDQRAATSQARQQLDFRPAGGATFGIQQGADQVTNRVIDSPATAQRMAAREKYQQLSPTQRLGTRVAARLGGASPQQIEEIARPVADTEQRAGSFGRGVADIASTAVRGLPSVVRNPYMPTLPNQAIAGATDEMARRIDRSAQTIAPVNPDDQGWTTTKIPRAAGSVVPFVAASAITGGSAAAPTVMGALASAGQYRKDAADSGKQISPGRYAAGEAMAVATGMTEALGIGRALKSMGVAKPVIERAAQILEESGQEYAQKYLEDINAKLVGGYDPNRSLSPTDPAKLEAAALGAILGGGMAAPSLPGDIRAQREAKVGAQQVAAEPRRPMNLTPTTVGPTRRIPVTPEDVRRARDWNPETASATKPMPEQQANEADAVLDDDVLSWAGAKKPAAKPARPQMAAGDLRGQVDTLKTEAVEAENAGNLEVARTKYRSAQQLLNELRGQARRAGNAEEFTRLTDEANAANRNWQLAGNRANRAARQQALPPQVQQGQQVKLPLAPTGDQNSQIPSQPIENKGQNIGDQPAPRMSNPTVNENQAISVNGNAPTRDLTSELPASKEAAPRPQGRVVTIGDKQIELSPEQEARWRKEVDEPAQRAKERYQEDMAQAAKYESEASRYPPGSPERNNLLQAAAGIKVQAPKNSKAAGFTLAAKKREIAGQLTAKEQSNKAKRDATNYQGKQVSVPVGNGRQNGEVVGNSFGKARVRLANGSVISVDPGDVGTPVEQAELPRVDTPQTPKTALRFEDVEGLRFTTAQGSEYVFRDGRTQRNKVPHAGEEHKGDVGVKSPSDETLFVSSQDASAVGMWNTSSGKDKRVIKRGNEILLTSINPKTGQRGVDHRIQTHQKEPVKGLSPLELWGKDESGFYRNNHPGNEITEIAEPPRVPNSDKLPQVPAKPEEVSEYPTQEPTNRLTEGAGDELPRRVSRPLEGQPIEVPEKATEVPKHFPAMPDNIAISETTINPATGKPYSAEDIQRATQGMQQLRDREALPPVERRRAGRDAVPKGQFGKLSESAYKKQDREFRLVEHPQVRRLLGLPEMPPYHLPDAPINPKTGQPYVNPEWQTAAQDTLNALAGVAGKERSSQINFGLGDTHAKTGKPTHGEMGDLYRTVQKLARKNRERIEPSLDAAFKGTVEGARTAQQGYQKFSVDDRIENIRQSLDELYQNGKLSREENKAHQDAWREIANEYGLSGSQADQLFAGTKAEARTRAERTRTAQPAGADTSRSESGSRGLVSGTEERATGTTGKPVERAVVPGAESRSAARDGDAVKPATRQDTEAPSENVMSREDWGKVKGPDPHGNYSVTVFGTGEVKRVGKANAGGHDRSQQTRQRAKTFKSARTAQEYLDAEYTKAMKAGNVPAAPETLAIEKLGNVRVMPPSADDPPNLRLVEFVDKPGSAYVSESDLEAAGAKSAVGGAARMRARLESQAAEIKERLQGRMRPEHRAMEDRQLHDIEQRLSKLAGEEAKAPDVARDSGADRGTGSAKAEAKPVAKKGVPTAAPKVVESPRTESTPQQPTEAVNEKAKPAGTRKRRVSVSEPVKASGRVARGGESTLTIPRNKQQHPIRYEVRELSDIQPSHNPFSFEKNPDYRLVNDRDYTNPANRLDVEDATKAGVFDPRLLLTDDPTATNGPPVIHEGGDVLGGNSRTMMLARVYHNHPVDGQKYRKALTDRAAMFGLKPKDLARLDRPVLVRVIDAKPENLQKLITDLNIQPGKAMTSTEAASARGKNLPPETMKFLGDRLFAEGPDGTLAEALRGQKGITVLDRLIRDGAIPSGERNRYITDQGEISAVAKQEIEGMLLSRMFDSADQMKAAPASVKNKLARIAPHLAKVSGTEWDISKSIPNALRAADTSKAQQIDLEMLNQRGPSLFGEVEQYTPEELALARYIKELGPRQLENKFAEYVTGFEESEKGAGLFGNPPSQKEVFDKVFKPARAPKGAVRSFLEDEGGSASLGLGAEQLLGKLKSKPKEAPKLDPKFDIPKYARGVINQVTSQTQSGVEKPASLKMNPAQQAELNAALRALKDAGQKNDREAAFQAKAQLDNLMATSRRAQRRQDPIAKIRPELAEAKRYAEDKYKAGKITETHKDSILSAAEHLKQVAKQGNPVAIQKAQRELRDAKRDIQNKGTLTRFGYKIADGAGQTVRGAQTAVFGSDWSYIFRQGGPIALNPANLLNGNTFKAFNLAYHAQGRESAQPQGKLGFVSRAFVGSKGAEFVRDQLQNNPNYNEAVRAGLEMSVNSGAEEIYKNNFVSKAPWIKRTEAANEAALDYLRLQEFGRYVDRINKQKGRTFTERQNDLERAAETINTLTGRTDLGDGKVKKLVDFLNGPFAAPRLNVSRVKILDPTRIPREFAKSSPVAKQMLQDAFYTAGFWGAAMALGNAAGIWSTTLDYDDPDFGKIKVGDTRYDIAFGLLPLLRLYLKSGEYAIRAGQDAFTQTGRSQKVKEEAGRTAGNAAKTFLRGRLGPAYSYANDLWWGENLIGEPVNLRQVPTLEKQSPARRLVVPVTYGEMGEMGWKYGAQRKAEGVPGIVKGAAKGVAKAAFGTVGIGVQDYEKKPRRRVGASR